MRTLADIPVIDGTLTIDPDDYRVLNDSEKERITRDLADCGINWAKTRQITYLATSSGRFIPLEATVVLSR